MEDDIIMGIREEDNTLEEVETETQKSVSKTGYSALIGQTVNAL